MRLSKIFSFFFHLFDFGVHVSKFTVDHNDAEVSFIICKWVLVGHDIDMSKFLQYFQFILYILSFFFINFKSFDLFKSIIIVFVSFVFAQEHVSWWTESEKWYPVPISLPISYSYIFLSFSKNIINYSWSKKLSFCLRTALI